MSTSRSFTCDGQDPARAVRPPRQYEIPLLPHNLASVERSAGWWDRAEGLYGRTIELKRELLGHDHPDLAVVPGRAGGAEAVRDSIASAITTFTEQLRRSSSSVAQTRTATASYASTFPRHRAQHVADLAAVAAR